MEGPVDGSPRLAEPLGARLASEEDAGAAVHAGARRLVAWECTVAITALPAAGVAHPGLRVAWFDAHPDFHTPQSSTSGYRGGMPLAAACGLWDAGSSADPPIDPERVHLLGIRDVDPGERELIATHSVRSDPPPDGPVWVHLDLDVLRGDLMPAAYPAPGGWDWDELVAAVEALPEIVGFSITSCDARHADEVARRLSPVMVRT